jgi:glycosyltransferase involved in cell wall biosynthesis
MPVYNGALFIEQAIESLINQSFQDWSLLIADNASTDTTEEICRNFLKKDPRIKYIRHERNIGALGNFEFLLNSADTPYFMWAASDDCWKSNFIEDCMSQLQSNRNIGMAFSSIDVIDSFGQKIRDLPGFSKLKGKANAITIAKYVLSPEFDGKANLIYSIYRTDLCKKAWARFSCPNGWGWGSDMGFVLTAISISGVVVSSEINFRKRYCRSDDELGKPAMINPPKKYTERSCPLSEWKNYEIEMLRAVRGSRFYSMVRVLIFLRYAYIWVFSKKNHT